MRGKKRYSMRGKLIKANISILLAALVLCGGIFAVSVFMIVGNYIHTDINYFLTTTAEHMEAKLEYCEEVIYSLRDSKTVMDYLGGIERNGGWQGDIREVEEAFAQTAAISTSANLGNGSEPVVEEIYLFDNSGNCVSTEYYAMLSTEKEESRRVFDRVYESYERSRIKNTAPGSAFITEGEYTFLVFPLLDGQMDKLGEVIFKINDRAVKLLMSDMENYRDSFWGLYDLAGNYITGENAVLLDGEERIFRESRYTPYITKLNGMKYRVYRRVLCMDMQEITGIPENQAMFLMYDSAKIYMLLIAVITVLGCVVSFPVIYRLTRPVEEITDKLLEVKEGDFETKLPEYDSREFNEISETFNDMTAYISHLVNQVYEKQISIKNMELKFLQSQMNPHFMFNVLNTIALQAKLDGNEDVYRMISSFSQLVQAKIYRSGKEKVKIGQELQYVEYYLYLQKYRFGEHLTYQIEVEDEGLKELYLPKLCIQLTVENAVVHGIEPKVEGGNIQVRVYEREGALHIDTADDGVGFEQEGCIQLPLGQKESDNRHNRVALNNAHHIIQMIYGQEYGITIYSNKGKGATVSICIPLDDGGKWENMNDKSDACG